MEQYIKKQDLIDWCNETYQKQTKIQGKEYCNAFLQAVVMSPTADVVPKSEVEKWKQINEQLHKEMYERMMEERKIERKLVAREIFEKIESGIAELYPIIYAPTLNKFLAELKKKYTEGEQDVQT